MWFDNPDAGLGEHLAYGSLLSALGICILNLTLTMATYRYGYGRGSAIVLHQDILGSLILFSAMYLLTKYRISQANLAAYLVGSTIASSYFYPLGGLSCRRYSRDDKAVAVHSSCCEIEY